MSKKVAVKHIGMKKPARTHRKAIIFNDQEMEAIEHFCEKYKIKSQSKFFREAIISTVLHKLEEDHPTLF